MQTLRLPTRLILLIASLALITTYFVPTWEIQLWAPQYPEGLHMNIWLHKISGDFDIINGLNHYIGMKTIKQEMFPEFKFMGYIVGAIILIGLLPALIGRRRWLYVFFATLCLAGILGMVDYYRWGYAYGHDLNPHAAISVPGMSYSPPVFGYKALLNFVAYSGPDIGGWMFIGVGVIAAALIGAELFINRVRPAKK